MRLAPAALFAALLLAGCLATPAPEASTPDVFTPGGASLPTNVAWRALADAPLQRNEVCASHVGAKFYLIGGYFNAAETSLPGPAGSLPASVPLARVDIYDADKNTWSAGPDFPSNLDHCLAYNIGDTIYVVSHGYKIQAGAPAWTRIASSPNGHTAGAGGVIDGKIYVTGGGSTKLDVYDPATDAWTTLEAPLPTARGHTSGAAANGKLYIIGGDTGGHSQNTGANEEYDPATGVWTERASLPVIRGSLKAFEYFGHVVVMGGQNGATAVPSFADVNVYDPITDSWSEFPKMSHGRHGFDGGVWAGRVYVFAGSPQQGVDATAKSDVLEPKT